MEIHPQRASNTSYQIIRAILDMDKKLLDQICEGPIFTR